MKSLRLVVAMVAVLMAAQRQVLFASSGSSARYQTDVLRASLAGARAIPAAAVPASGTFWSLPKLEEQPPLPFNPFPGLPFMPSGRHVSR